MEALDLTVQEEIEQRGIDQTVETVTAVSVDDTAVGVLEFRVK